MIEALLWKAYRYPLTQKYDLRKVLPLIYFFARITNFKRNSAETSFFARDSAKGATPRAENGVLDPCSLDLRLGGPRFLPQISPKHFKIRVLGPLG